jgi:hypothetical protein
MKLNKFKFQLSSYRALFFCSLLCFPLLTGEASAAKPAAKVHVKGQVFHCTDALVSEMARCPKRARLALEYFRLKVFRVGSTKAIKELRADRRGRFAIKLAPGKYYLSNAATGCVGSTCTPQEYYVGGVSSSGQAEGFSFVVKTKGTPTLTVPAVIPAPDEIPPSATPRNCPEGYTAVAANPQLDTAEFCVARYEMKRVADKPLSLAGGRPWIDVSRNQALELCAGLGFGYRLISNAEWQAVAREIESVGKNWSGGAPGLGTLNIGNFSKESGAAIEGNACATEGFALRFPNCEAPLHSDFLRKRTHLLRSGALIWDVGGNAAEWVSTDIGPSIPGDFRGPPCSLSGSYQTNFGPAGSYNRPCNSLNSEGFGCIEGEFGSVIFRGGSAGWESSEWHYCPGVFYANTNAFWSANKAGPGFRCVFR